MRNSGFDPVSAEIFSKRFRAVALLVTVSVAILVLRLWFMQIVYGPDYRVKSENNRIHLQNIPPLRGMILDRDGELLVDNRPSYNLYVVPEEIPNRRQLLTNLQGLIGLEPATVEARMKDEQQIYPFKPILIKRDMTRRELAVIETNLFNLPGVKIQVQLQRHYPFGKLASHLIGYLGEISEAQLDSGRYPYNRSGDLIGKYGVEGGWQKHLNGLRGGEQVEMDAAGRKLRVISRKPPVSGLSLSLTVDKDLQLLADNQLKGKKGAIVAIDPNNGEILALSSSPGFDPNLFIGEVDRKEWQRLVTSKDHPLQNRAASGQYPPGSIFKVVMALAGLEEGIIDPKEEVFCNGRYVFGNHTYNCWKKGGHGSISLHRALVESCDYYFYRVGRRLGIDKIAQYAMMCGLGKSTGVGLDSEKDGLIPTREWKLKRFGVPWQPGETISMSIGQSFVLVTPIQMSRFISSIFNGGYLYKPEVIRWVGKDKLNIYQFTPTVTGRIRAKKEHLELIKRALIDVVNGPHGTGSKARLKDVVVAGKTGTSQVITLAAQKGFGKESAVPPELRDHAWFMAIAPAEQPVIALAILIENGGHGGSVAAPIAGELINAYLRKG